MLVYKGDNRMFEKFKANIMFKKLLQRHDISKAYAMVKPNDSWYDTITKVHNSLAEIQKLPHETLEITSHDNLKLRGIYYPAKNGSDVTVICLHGYSSHAEREWAFPGLFYLSLGYNVLIPYQRAHGISEGEYITVGALEEKDMQRWIAKVNEMHSGGSIILHGLSMGGGIALYLSDKEIKNLKGIIADAPSTRIKFMFEDVAGHVFKNDAEKVLPFACERFNKEFNVDINDYDALKIIKSCKYPILLSAGSMENKEEEFAKLKENNPNRTEIIILEGCNHGNGMYKQTQTYQNKIAEFINSVM